MSELELWNELGNIYFKVCAYEEAIGAYEKAIEVDRRFGWSYSNLALVYAQKGSYAEAIPLYRKSIELLENDKDRAIAWNRLGNTYRQLNDYSNAMAAYQRAVELDADNVSFRNDWLEWGAAQAVASTPPGVLKKEVAAGMSGCSVPEPSLRSMEEAFDSTPLGGGISSGILSQDIEGSLLERAQKALGGGRSAEKVQKSSQDDEGYTSKPLAHGKVTEEKETSNECTTASRFAPVIEAQYNNRIFSNELKQEYSSPLSHADNITLKGMPSEYHNQSAVLLDELPQWKIERKKVSPITEQIAGDEEISRWRQYSPEETSEVTISHPEVQKSKHPEMYYENPEVIAQTPDEGQMIDSDEWVPTEEIENQTKETTPLPNGMTVDEINSITQEPHELPLKNSTHDKKIDVLERVRNIFRQSKSSEARHDGYAPYDLDRLGDVIVADKKETEHITTAADDKIDEHKSVSSSDNGHYSKIHNILDHLNSDISTYKKVTEINPTNDRAWDTLGNLLRAAGNYNEAMAAFEKAISLNPNREAYYYHLGLVYAALKNYDDAVSVFHKVIEINPDYNLAHCALAGYYRKLGLEAEANKHITIALPTMQGESEYNRACFEAICGNINQAIELLKIALEQKQTSVDWVRRDPDLDFIREDPRYDELVREEALVVN